VLELNHGDELSSADFFPDGKRAITGGNEGAVKVWQLSDQQLLTEALSRVDEPVIQVGFSADGQLLGILSARGSTPKDIARRRVRLIQVESLAELSETADAAFSVSFAFDNDQTHVVVATSNGKLLRYGPDREKPTAVQSQFRKSYGQMVALPGTDLVAITSLSGTTDILNSRLQAVHDLSTHSKSFGVVDVSGDGRVMVVGGGDGIARVIDATAVSTTETIWTNGVVRRLAFTADGHSIAMACGDGSVQLWNPESDNTPSVICQDSRGRAILSVDVDRRTGHVVACGMQRELNVTDPATGSQVSQAILPFGGYSATAWSGDGNFLAVGSRSGNVLFFDVQQMTEPVAEYVHAEGVVNVVCAVGNSRDVAVGWADGRVTILNAETGTLVAELPALTSQPLSMAYSGATDLLVIGTQSGTLHGYAIKDRSERLQILAHSALISGLAVFPDGRQLVSGGLDGALNIWDLTSGELLGQLPGHNHHRTFAVAVAPDGKTIASSGLEGDVRLWRAKGFLPARDTSRE